MSSSPPLNVNELDLLVTYSLKDEEEMIEAIVNAFETIDIGLFNKSTVLQHWISADILEHIRSSDCSMHLCTPIWNHQVMITPDEVRIYTLPTHLNCR